MIAAGHRPADVWEYSPREIAGYLALAAERHKMEVAEQLSINAMASRGDPKEVKKLIKDMSK